MKFTYAILLVMTLASFSCNKKDNNGTINYFKAEVVNTDDISCSRPLISIDPSDTAAVSVITGISSQMYVADQLPAKCQGAAAAFQVLSADVPDSLLHLGEIDRLARAGVDKRRRHDARTVVAVLVAQ